MQNFRAYANIGSRKTPAHILEKIKAVVEFADGEPLNKE